MLQLLEDCVIQGTRLAFSLEKPIILYPLLLKFSLFHLPSHTVHRDLCLKILPFNFPNQIVYMPHCFNNSLVQLCHRFLYVITFWNCYISISIFVNLENNSFLYNLSQLLNDFFYYSFNKYKKVQYISRKKWNLKLDMLGLVFENSITF